MSYITSRNSLIYWYHMINVVVSILVIAYYMYVLVCALKRVVRLKVLCQQCYVPASSYTKIKQAVAKQASAKMC